MKSTHGEPISPAERHRRRVRGYRLAALITIWIAVVALGAYGAYAMMGGAGPSTGSVWGTKLGLSRTAAGHLSVRVLTCPGEQVSDMQLTESDRGFTTTGPKLWEIRSTGHPALAQFAVGSAPAGFVITKAFTSSPGPHQPLILDIRTSGRHGAFFEVDFMPREVRSGSVLVAGPGFLGTKSPRCRRPVQFSSQ